MDIKKGKHTVVFAKYPEAKERLCVSIIMRERTLDLEAKNKKDRDAFYHTAVTLWEKYSLESEGCTQTPLLLEEANFQGMLFLLTQALRMIQENGGRESVAEIELMKVAERVCFRTPDSGTHQFVRDFLGGFFVRKPSSFWADGFWRTQKEKVTLRWMNARTTGQLARGKTEFFDTLDDLEDDMMPDVLVTNIMKYCGSLWDWRVPLKGLKEFVKLMHGNEDLADVVLFDLLKFVTEVHTLFSNGQGDKQGREGAIQRHVSAMRKRIQRDNQRNRSRSLIKK